MWQGRATLFHCSYFSFHCLSFFSLFIIVFLSWFSICFVFHWTSQGIQVSFFCFCFVCLIFFCTRFHLHVLNLLVITTLSTFICLYYWKKPNVNVPNSYVCMTSAMESHHPVRPKPMNHEFFCTIVFGLTWPCFFWCISSKKVRCNTRSLANGVRANIHLLQRAKYSACILITSS